MVPEWFRKSEAGEAAERREGNESVALLSVSDALFIYV